MSLSPTRKRKYVPKKDTTPSKAPRREYDSTPRTAPQREDDDRTPPRRVYVPTTGRRTPPPSKQQQRSYTGSRPTDKRPPTRAPRYTAGRQPRIGVGERFSPDHVTWVRNQWNPDALFDLWDGLGGENGRRWNLINEVEGQLIRAQLREMMGGPIATRANIQVDGEIYSMTPTRDVSSVRIGDTPMDSSDEEDSDERTVWNASLKDAEVDTIEDIRIWAGRQTVESLRGKKQVLIQIPGVSGPCDACKRRLTNMADAILDSWVDMGVPEDKLPQLRIESYYGNPTAMFTRHRVPSRNGWLGDRTPGDLTFVNKKGYTQNVRQHVMYQSRRPVDTPDGSEESE